MRSPVIAFSILAAAAVSPSLVSGAPTSPKIDSALVHTTEAAANTHHIRSPTGPNDLPVSSLFSGLSPPAAAPATNDKVQDPVHRTAAMKKAQESTTQPLNAATVKKGKRAMEMYSAGGNAYSGAASDSSGGDVENETSDGTLTNADGSNAAGGAGSSFSGFAFGGNGNGHGPGGNAYTGATGASRGGNVINTEQGGDAAGGDGGSDIDNTTANNAGGGGLSESGTAMGGNAAGPKLPDGVQRRAMDQSTAGGSAYSGATSDVSGGSVVNEADDRGTISNDGGNTAGGAGTTFSGDADGGNGNGLGPGGNAYSGASGPAVGGGVYNYGGTIDNAEDSNIAGGGGVSQTGDATGGRA